MYLTYLSLYDCRIDSNTIHLQKMTMLQSYIYTKILKPRYKLNLLFLIFNYSV